MHNAGKSGAQIHSARGFWVRLKLGGGQCWPHWSEVAYCELALDGVSAGFWSVGTHTTSSRTSVERRRAARARRSLFSRGERGSACTDCTHHHLAVAVHSEEAAGRMGGRGHPSHRSDDRPQLQDVDVL